MQIKDWAIINSDGGWLEMVVRWDGNTKKWNPKNGTYAVLKEQINLSTLPPNPQEINDAVEIILDIENAGTY
jgi:hypothetical protein